MYGSAIAQTPVARRHLFASLRDAVNAPVYQLVAFTFIVMAGLSASLMVTASLTRYADEVDRLAVSNFIRSGSAHHGQDSNLVFGGQVAGASTEIIQWTNLSNATFSGDTLTSSSACDCGVEDGKAISSTAFYGDTSFEYTVPALANNLYLGVDGSTSLLDGAGMDLSFWHRSNGVTEIRENGVYKGEVSYVAGDVFTIEMTSGSAKYFKNENIIYTSSFSYSFPMYAHASMQYKGSSVSGATFFKLYDTSIEPGGTVSKEPVVTKEPVVNEPVVTAEPVVTEQPTTNTETQNTTTDTTQQTTSKGKPTTSTNQKPVGYLDGVRQDVLFGWALDPDHVDKPVEIHFYIDERAGKGKSPAFTGIANEVRSDVGTHAFNVQIPERFKDGVRHRAYAYAIDLDDATGSSNILLKGSPVNFTLTSSTTPPPTTNQSPTGSLDGVDVSTGLVYGWAKDADNDSSPIAVHLYFDKNAGTSGASPVFCAADQFRSDVGMHGFSCSIPSVLKDGTTHQVWAWGIDLTGGTNTQLSGSPKSFVWGTTPTPPPTTNQPPTGNLDGVDTSRGVVYGWAKDADNESAAVEVHLYFDKNAGTSGASPILCTANISRTDVGQHGFDCPVPSAYKDGNTHQVWAWGIDLTGGTNTQLPGSPKSFIFTTNTPPPPPISDSNPVAELPRVYVNTTLVPQSGKIINVPAGGNFQTALNDAQCGDTIVLAAGATYSGNFVAPSKGCSGNSWIHIQSSKYSSLPAPGKRVGPSDVANMAKIVSPNVGSALLFDLGATNYRVMGLEVTGACANCDSRVYTLYSLVSMGEDANGNKATSPSQLPNNIVLDRMYIHGSPTGNYRRAVQMNSRASAVIDSYLSDIHEVGADSQAIGGWNGPGPFKIFNNYLEAAGENIIFGGADPASLSMMPQDIEIRNNYMFKPLAWKSNNPDWVVKNLFELKLGLRVLVEGNVFENNWTDAQNGFGILFTVRNQDGSAPYSEVSDVTFRYNWIKNSESGVNLHASDYNQTSQVTKRIDISNNLFEGISGRVIQTGTSVGAGTNYRFNNNTVVSSSYNNLWSLGDDPSIKYDQFKFNNNIALHGTYGIFGSGVGIGNSALNAYLTNYEVTKNVFVGGGSSSSYPAGNYFVSDYSNVGFADYNNKNYALASSSQYKNAGTNGKDLGIDAVNFYAVTACVVAGTCGGGTTPTPPPTPTTVRDGYGDTLSGAKFDGWFYDSTGQDTSAIVTYVNTSDSTKTYTQTATRTVTRTDAASWLTQTYGSGLTINQPLGFSINPSSVVTTPGTYRIQSVRLNSSNTNISLGSGASGTFTVSGSTGGTVLSNQVTLNTSTQYQTITGWEATAQAAQLSEAGTPSQYSTNDSPAFAQYQNALFDHMVGELGITRLRIEMHSGVENPTDYFTQYLNKQISFSQYFNGHAYEIINDNSNSSSINTAGFQFSSIDHQIDKILLPVKSRVEARGDKFHFNLCYVDFGTSSFEHYSDPNEYAELILAFFQHSQSKYGFVPDTIEMVLETDLTGWNGTRLGQAMQATQSKLSAAGFNPKFVLPSVTNISNATSYFDAARNVVGDTFISNYVAELSYHRYGGANSTQLTSVASKATQYGIGTSHLELIGANIDNMFDDLGIANNSAWAQYTIAWPSSDGSDDGGKYYLIGSSNQLVIGSRTMSLSQIMNYVRPNAKRVGASSNQGGLKSLGFTNSNGKEVVVVKNNIGSTSFSVLGLSSGTYGISYVRYNQTTRTNLADVTITAGQPVNVTMPGGGTATVYKK